MADEKVDERGVPIENVAKEVDRKVSRYENELNAMRQELNELRAQKAQPVQVPHAESQRQNQAELEELIAKGPRSLIREELQRADEERRKSSWNSEVMEAQQWLESRPGYNRDNDEPRVRQLIEENMWNTPMHTPKKRAELVARALDTERKLKGLSANTDDKAREDRISQTATEGVGRSTPKQAGPSYDDLSKRLAAASAKGDMMEEAKIIGLMEDVRRPEREW